MPIVASGRAARLRHMPGRNQCEAVHSLYTFHLNESVVWHDGKPFSAEGVVFSIDVFCENSALVFASTP